MVKQVLRSEQVARRQNVAGWKNPSGKARAWPRCCCCCRCPCWGARHSKGSSVDKESIHSSQSRGSSAQSRGSSGGALPRAGSDVECSDRSAGTSAESYMSLEVLSDLDSGKDGSVDSSGRRHHSGAARRSREASASALAREALLQAHARSDSPVPEAIPESPPNKSPIPRTRDLRTTSESTARTASSKPSEKAAGLGSSDGRGATSAPPSLGR